MTWDEGKRRRNCTEHGIDFADLEGFFDRDLLTREDVREAYGEQRFQSLGAFQGTIVFVAWALRGVDENTPHLISARKADKHEAQAWCNRYAKQGSR